MKMLAFVSLLVISAIAFAGNADDAITTDEQFGRFAQDYYIDPRPELVESAMRFAAGSPLVKQAKTSHLVQMSFSCIFARHPERRDAWKTFISGLEEPGRAFFATSMEQTPEQLLEAVPLSPQKNDMNWGCFFATGDARYARNVVDTLAYLGERKDLQKYLAASSAQWSLADISRAHDRVREVLEAAAKGKDATIAAGAGEALAKPASEIREATVQVLRQQHEAGVWK